VKNGKAYLYENRCIDCGECFRVCPVHAIYIDHDDFNQIFYYKYRVALVPGVLIGQFPENIPTQQIYSGLLEIGFTHVFEIEHTVDILLNARETFKKNNPETKPLISTFCPAIVRLIQVKFPSLVENLILLKSPLEIAALYQKKLLIEQGIPEKEIGLFYITQCPAKIAAVKSPVGEDKSEITV
jgi:iron only hydrogenase large subunit-like protein